MKREEWRHSSPVPSAQQVWETSFGDGLHFSPAGFKAMGEGLAPSIAKILK